MSAEEIKDPVNLEAAPASGIQVFTFSVQMAAMQIPTSCISKYSFHLSTHSFDLLENKMKDPISKKPQSWGQ